MTTVVATLSTCEEFIAVDIKTNRMKLMDNFDGKNNCVIFNTEQSVFMRQNSRKFEN
jgi:threonine dehydrogenase-like Zn-dependent dehydrogenase